MAETQVTKVDKRAAKKRGPQKSASDTTLASELALSKAERKRLVRAEMLLDITIKWRVCRL